MGQYRVNHLHNHLHLRSKSDGKTLNMFYKHRNSTYEDDVPDIIPLGFLI